MKLSSEQYVQLYEGLIERQREVRGKGKLADNIQRVALKLGLPAGLQYYDLMNNMRREYSAFFTSGAATEEVPMLRRSAAVFEAFDRYMKAFYPKGSSAVPTKIMEPGTVYEPSPEPARNNLRTNTTNQRSNEQGACSSEQSQWDTNDSASAILLSYLPDVRAMDQYSLRVLRSQLNTVISQILKDQEDRQPNYASDFVDL